MWQRQIHLPRRSGKWPSRAAGCGSWMKTTSASFSSGRRFSAQARFASSYAASIAGDGETVWPCRALWKDFVHW